MEPVVQLLVIVWTGPAKRQIEPLGNEAKSEHERRVREHARACMPHATIARIR